MSVTKKQQVLTTVSATFDSEIIELDSFKGYSVGINLSNHSSYTGSVELQITNDSDGQWLVVPSSNTALTGDDFHIFDIPASAASFVKLVVVVTTGDADMKIDWTLKD